MTGLQFLPCKAGKEWAGPGSRPGFKKQQAKGLIKVPLFTRGCEDHVRPQGGTASQHQPSTHPPLLRKFRFAHREHLSPALKGRFGGQGRGPTPCSGAWPICTSQPQDHSDWFSSGCEAGCRVGWDHQEQTLFFSWKDRLCVGPTHRTE